MSPARHKRRGNRPTAFQNARWVGLAVALGLVAGCIGDPGRVQMAAVRNRTAVELRIVTEVERGATPSERGRLAPGEETALGVMFVSPGKRPLGGVLRAYDAAGQLVFCDRYERTYEQAQQPMAIDLVAGRATC